MLRRLGLLVMVVALACAPSPPSTPAPPASTEEARLPPSLEALEPTPAQRAELEAVLAGLTRDLASAEAATGDFLRALARAARRCRQDSPFLAMEAERLVRLGEEARPAVLDAINGIHAILSPAQRRALAQRLLGQQQEDERTREDRDASRTRSIGGDLDLSIGQMLAILVRVRKLRNAFEDEVAPWRERYARAVRAFEDDRFDIRDHAVAEVPLVAIMTGFVRDAFRVLMPLLEPPQCEALARVIEERID